MIALAIAGAVNMAMVMMASAAFHAGHSDVADIQTAYHTLTPLLGIDARARHRGKAVLVGVFEMIGRQSAMLSRERGAARVRQLIGVQLHRNPGALCGGEHAGDLVAGEGDRLANPSTASMRPSPASAGIIVSAT